MRRLRAAKLLAGPVQGIPLAALPVGLIAFGGDGRAFIAFVETEPLAMGWQGMVARSREIGALTPDVLDEWAATAANGVTLDIESMDIPIAPGETDRQAFDRAWDGVMAEWAAVSIETAAMLDDWERQVADERRREMEEALV